MTKFNTILIFALFIGIASARVTNLEVMKAWNFARTNPEQIITMFQNTYINKGVNGVFGDAVCYKSAVEALQKAAPQAPLTESVGAALAATMHSRFIVKSKDAKLSHTGENNSNLETRLKAHGKFIANYNVFQMMTAFSQTTLVSANDIILHFIADCNNSDKSNRKAIFAPVADFTHSGVGIAVVGDKTIVTLVMTKSFSSFPVKNEVLTAAELEGNVDYSGKGQSMPTTSEKKSDSFEHKGKEIYPGLDPKNVAGKGPFENTEDDKSVRCPDKVNPAFAKVGGYFRDWALTTEKCVRGSEKWAKTNNLQRIAPFAKDKQCFHRLAYCSDQGLVWVKDREYNTLEAVDPTAAMQSSTPILKNFVDDKSVDCPPFVNGEILRIRFVQDWYANGTECRRGTGNFNADGFYSPKAIAMDKKCFHRVMYCTTDSKTMVRDSEYKTLAQYRAEAF